MSKMITTINPVDFCEIEKIPYANSNDVHLKIKAAQGAYLQWKNLGFSERIENLLNLKEQLSKNKADIALKMSLEMGKPITQSVAEVEKCLGLIDYCCEHAEEILAPEGRGSFSVYREPLGVIYGIMPWNFPVWQTLRFAIPTMLAGNTILLKPAENVAGTALVLQKCFDAVPGLKNIFSTLLIDHDTSDGVIASNEVRGVSLTGSSRAGAHVASLAGKYLKKCVLELGGNDAYIVCQDADLELACEKVFQARLLNTGQSCISAKRVFVHKAVEAEFVQNLIEKIKQLPVVDPTEESAKFGPLARKDLYDGLQKQMDQVLKDGATVSYTQDLGNFRGKGSFFPITVLQNIDSKNSVHREELFGPVFSVIRFETDYEVIAMANSSPYGLGGAVFSRDVGNAKKIALKIETGSIAINDFLRSTFERPFGGLKNSGFGRELGKEGFHEFTNLKVIV